MLARPAYEAIRDYVFAVIPLFMLMGEFIGRSGTVNDVYRGINRACAAYPAAWRSPPCSATRCSLS